MRRSIKVFIGLIIAIILLGLFVLYNSFNGNPISKSIAKNAAEDYLTKKYSDRDFIIEDVVYNFKDGYYHAEIVSPSSIDSHFYLAFAGSKLAYDSYEDNVLTGWNTYQRLDEEYRTRVDKLLSRSDFPLKSNIDFGELLMEEAGSRFDYGLDIAKLELDKNYDIDQLAKEHGNIVYYAEDEDVSYENMASLLLKLKVAFDEENLPFYTIDFNLEKPRTESGTPVTDGPAIYTEGILYEDIYEEGLAKRIEEAAKSLNDYYEEEDRK